MVKVKIDYISSVNYALINNGIAVCKSMEIENEGKEELRDIIIECSGEFFRDFRSGVIDTIKGGETIRYAGLKLNLLPEKLATVTERIASSFTVRLLTCSREGDTSELFSQSYDVNIMAYDQWLGTSIAPQCLASFVTPNHPAIGDVLIKAGNKLKHLSESSSFTGYQSHNSNEVRRQVAAIFGALHEENIVYRPMPASYEKIGQRITLPSQVLSSKLGNCIELTLLFASLLEAVGINCGIILTREHAFLAVWLINDCCPYSIYDDGAYVEKKCSDGISEMLVLEATEIAAEKTSFEEAISGANVALAKNIRNPAECFTFIDVKRCRMEHVRPLPQRIGDDVEEKVIDGVEHNDCILEVKEHVRYDLSRGTESNKISPKIDIWERKLLDFSKKTNSMLDLKLNQKAIQLISFDLKMLDDSLQEGNEFVIVGKPTNADVDRDMRIVRSKIYPELRDTVSSDIKRNILHTYSPEQETKDTLKNLYRKSREISEETGASALYLAIGLLRWYDAETPKEPCYAPILMLPVEMVYKKSGYYMRMRDEDMMLNITLVEYLRQNLDIDISGLTPFPRDERGAIDVDKIFALLRDALSNHNGWDIEDEAVLGLFSFSKFIMWHDIHTHHEELMEHDIVRSLIEQKLTFVPNQVASDLKDVDKTIRPEALALPVPVDSSQMAAVIASTQGGSFILYGPPGTGKSQTITNIISNALFQGKRVLFVSEKMAALSVVQQRLEKINLAPFCLELHSNKATKQHVLSQLKMSLDVARIHSPEAYKRTADGLYEQRTELIKYMEALHDVKGEEGMSLYDCLVRYSAIKEPVLDIDVSDAELKKHFRVDKLDIYTHLLVYKYKAVIGLIGHPSRHPLLGFNVQDEDLADLTQIPRRIEETMNVLKNAVERYSYFNRAETLKRELLRACTEDLFNQNAEALYREWREIKMQWMLPRFFGKKDFLKKLRAFNPLLVEEEIDSFLSKFIDYTEVHREIVVVQDALNRFFGIKLDEDILPEKEELLQYVARLERYRCHTDGARDWYQWCAYKRELEAHGLGVVSRRIEAGEIAADSLCGSFLKAMFKNLANEKIAQSSVLRTFEGSIFDETIQRYKKLTEEFQLLSQKELYARLAANIPRIDESIDDSSPIGLLNRSIANGGRGKPLRELFTQIEPLLPRLCPCMLMSPMSVVQYLDFSQPKFDIVIFDEASQMPTSEAIGSIVRGKSLIVVGDPKQMPPTSFFKSSNVSEEEAHIDDLDSILDDCRILGLPALQLNWHYRSKHESLIAFSNNEYYEGNLITFPSIDDQKSMVKYRYIPDGIYEKGGRKSNRKEAEAIVDEVISRLSSPKDRLLSIGVIAFNINQKELIEDLLEERLDKDKNLRQVADEMYEPIFVKNLESVQGDERDLIIFSIGYGPDKDGKASMNFGPLNADGGERRLNVAVSRARREMLVFSSLRSSQIDLQRSQARGVAGLKHFLEYAEKQILVKLSGEKKEDSDVIVASRIAQELRELGYEVRTNVGRSNFKVDVAIVDTEHKGNYLLGILLDGKGYHGTQTTSDREIVQPSVLKTLGWRVMRVWSVDWLNNPERVLRRIEEALQRAEPVEEEEPAEPMTFDVSQEQQVEEPKTLVREYVSYSDSNGSIMDMSDEELLQEILTDEQPMTLEYLTKCICEHRDLTKATPSLTATIQSVVEKKMYIQKFGSSTVLWTDKEQADAFEGYRPLGKRNITEAPIIEVMNAIMIAVEQRISVKRGELRLAVARKWGAYRGVKVNKMLDEVIDMLLEENKLVEENGLIKLPESSFS